MRKCEECGIEFKPNRDWQKFCCRECGIEYRNKRRKKYEKVCLNCANKYMGAKEQKYCCRECFKGLIGYKNCELCGIKFKPAHKQNRFCSRKCSSKNKSINKTINTLCDYCGKEISYIKYKQKFKHHFCSVDCGARYRSDNLYGERHPLWLGGKIDGRGYRWRKIRKIVLEKYKYTCQKCGRIPKETNNLDVHHIKRFRDFDNSKDANKLNNLLLVCKTCHTKYFTNKGL